MSGGNITLVNNTVANNTITPGLGYGGARNGEALGGGIDVGSGVTLDNNTITQNSVNGTANYGSGLWFESDSTLINNLIQGNQSIGSSALELDTGNIPLSNVHNNFITSVNSAARVNTTTNIVGNPQTQLGGVVGVTAGGNPSGGPIYYPLLPNTVSIGAGTTSVLNTIAGIEGTTTHKATDEIDNPRSTNGSIDLGAVQFQNSNNSSAPVITSNPSSQSATAGTDVTFTASASGTPTPTVQWQVSTDGGKTFTNISGATATLTLNNVTTAMNGYEYQAVFTNSAGSITTTAATLTVNAAVSSKPYIVSNPVSQTATAGTTVTFTASAGGTPTPTVQWQAIIDGRLHEIIPGATSTTLTLNNVTTAMNGYEYQAVFTNSDGSITTKTAMLTVNAALSPPPPPPSPTLHVPPLLAFFDALLGGVETVNANGTETITDSFFGIPLLVSTFDSSGNLMSVDLFGFNITFLFR